MINISLFNRMQTDLTNFTDTAESSIRYLAMLVGPFYPILRIGNERLAFGCYLMRCSLLELDLQYGQISALQVTVSHKFMHGY